MEIHLKYIILLKCTIDISEKQKGLCMKYN